MTPAPRVRAVRPREVALVAALLAKPHDDADMLARAIIKAINTHRALEPAWVRVVRSGRAGAVLYGPYGTADAARHDDAAAGTAIRPVPAFVAQLVPPGGDHG